jgi:cytochrome c-type biogenesis protein/peptide methionine sulfoxide reductase msrA/msrB
LEDFSIIAQEYNESGALHVLSVVAPGFNGEMDEQGLKDWANGQQLDFPILFDSTGEVNRQFSIRAYPTSVFIDENGEVVQTRIGEIGAEELKSILDALLAS